MWESVFLLVFMVQVTFLYYKMLTCTTCWECPTAVRNQGAKTHRPSGLTEPPKLGPNENGGHTKNGGLAEKGAAAAAPFSAERSAYLMPVVAIPLIRKRWPKRKTRNTGNRDTMDIAKSDPQLVADCESTKARSATGTVNMSGSVR
jgi:hypothetical protein